MRLTLLLSREEVAEANHKKWYLVRHNYAPYGWLVTTTDQEDVKNYDSLKGEWILAHVAEYGIAHHIVSIHNRELAVEKQKRQVEEILERDRRI